MKKLLPYGIADFKRVLSKNFYYIDKTQFIPLIERIGSFLYLIPNPKYLKTLI